VISSDGEEEGLQVGQQKQVRSSICLLLDHAISWCAALVLIVRFLTYLQPDKERKAEDGSAEESASEVWRSVEVHPDQRPLVLNLLCPRSGRGGSGRALLASTAAQLPLLQSNVALQEMD
jgi:hypothetical protein